MIKNKEYDIMTAKPLINPNYVTSSLFLLTLLLLLLLFTVVTHAAPGPLPGLQIKTKTKTDIKTDIYIPKTLPTDFQITVGPEFYGTYEKPQKNGTIYDYINGGGEVYVKHGFRAVAHIIMETKNKNTITMDIYDMVMPQNALNAFEDKKICPAGYKKLKQGPPAKVYHYEPDYIIHMVKGKYLIIMSLNNDQLKETLAGFAKEIYKEK